MMSDSALRRDVRQVVGIVGGTRKEGVLYGRVISRSDFFPRKPFGRFQFGMVNFRLQKRCK